MSRRRRILLIIVGGLAGAVIAVAAALLTGQPIVAAILAGGSALVLALVGSVNTHPDTPAPEPVMPVPTTRLDPESPVRLPVVFGAIPQPAKWFQRRPEQDAIINALGDGKHTALVALPGQRGAGKTQLAAAHARACANDGFDLVAWINAETGPETELAQLAGVLKVGSPEQTPEQLADAAIRAVSASDGRRRLVVFDNVSDPDMIARFLPVAGTVQTLVTTNRQEFATTDGFSNVHIGVFTPEQGLMFLTQATGLLETTATSQAGEELGWLPLALGQAAAYMRMSNLTYEQYLAMLATLPLNETLARHAGASHPGILNATQLSLDTVGLDDPSGNTLNLLIVLSLLAPEGISRTLLTRQPAICALGVDGTSMTHALRVLASVSLITLATRTSSPSQLMQTHQDAVVVVVHRLTATVVRHYAAQRPRDQFGLATQAATRVLRALTDGLPEHQAALRAAEFGEIISHILALRDHCQSLSTDLLYLCSWAAIAMHEAGRYAQAIVMQEMNVTNYERICGLEHPETLTARSHLANAYQEAGRYAEAIIMHQQTLADRELILGPEHPSTLMSRNNLGGAYEKAGRYADAITTHRQNVADRERILGPEHTDTLVSRNNLARALQEAGRFTEAIIMHEQNLADRERIHGPEDLHALVSRNNLANAYQAAGRYAEAITMHQQNLATHERILGLEHPRTLISRNNLARAYQTAGRHQEAIALHEQNLADRERILGLEHPETLNSRNELAVGYSAVGHYEEAIALHEQNLADRERILGPEHPHTLASHNNLADAYALQAATTTPGS